MGSNVYTLTMLGTDTKFTPNSDKCYPNGETLSYLMTLLQGDNQIEGQHNEADDAIKHIVGAHKYHSESADLVDGPTTLGSEVGDRIALGSMLSLQALARGQTTLNIMGHSRGAVESILITHELFRIQQELAKNNDRSLKDIIADSDCPYTKRAFDALCKADLPFAEEALRNNIKKMEINMSLIDPVPGGGFFGVSPYAWRDERFYHLPRIVKHCDVSVYENEHTRCFKAIVPKADFPSTHVVYHKVPGHHGTGSGNLLTQQFAKKVGGKEINTNDTALIQRLFLLKGVHFLTQYGSELKPLDSLGDDHVLHAAVKDYAPDAYKEALMTLYDAIQKGKDTFKLFNQTSYSTLHQEWDVSQGRNIHYHQHQNHHLPEVLVSNDALVVNREHLRLKLEHWFGVFEGNTPSQVVGEFAERLSEALSSFEVQDLMASFNLNDKVDKKSQSLALHLHDCEDDDLALIDDAIKSLLNSVSQALIQNHLSVEEKLALQHSIIELYNMLPPVEEKSKSRLKKLVGRFANIINQQLIDTVEVQSSNIGDTIELIAKSPADYYLAAAKQESLKLLEQVAMQAQSLGLTNNENFNISLLKLINSFDKVRTESSELDELYAGVLEKVNIFTAEAYVVDGLDKDKLESFRDFMHQITPGNEGLVRWVKQKNQELFDELSLAWEANLDLLAAIESFEGSDKIKSGLTSEGFDFAKNRAKLEQNNLWLVEKAREMLTEHPELVCDNDDLKLVALKVPKLETQVAHQERRIESLEKTNKQVLDANHSLHSASEREKAAKLLAQKELKEERAAKGDVQTQLDGQVLANQTLRTQLNEQVLANQTLQIRFNQLAKESNSPKERAYGDLCVRLKEMTVDYKHHLESKGDVGGKLVAVQELEDCLDDFENTPLPSMRVEKFYKKLADNSADLSEHRHAKGASLAGRYVKNCVLGGLAVLGTLATGVIPGVLLAIYAGTTPGSGLRFWESHGKSFAGEVEDIKPQGLGG